MGKTYVKKKSWSGQMWNKRRFVYNFVIKKNKKIKKYRYIYIYKKRKKERKKERQKERNEERAEVAHKINIDPQWSGSDEIKS